MLNLIKIKPFSDLYLMFKAGIKHSQQKKQELRENTKIH